tara:strand:- start:2853 stop:10067 length:7215 start_codon:yes stop_codon:yes gene_type:complete
MLSKLFPRKLNHSADSKLRGKDDMSDAVNISVEGDDRGEDGGNENVIKPVKSNTALFGDIFSSNQKTVLGKVTDDKYNVIYFFVWDFDAAYCGVYAYDPDLYFSGHDADTIIKIYTSGRFNFEVDSFVNAEITYSQKKYKEAGRTYEDVPFLFFTDNRNEPRKLNVLRAYYEADLSNNYNVLSLDDFITACPKAPVHPVTFSWSSDQDLPVSEFRGVNGFQFAYQSVFKDGNVSAISTYSEVAVPPSYINQGANSSANLLAHNVCELTIPSIDLTLEVEKVKVLARRGNTGSWFEITELENFDFNAPLTYSFNNTSVNIAVSKDDQIKQFDNLPKIAETQAIEGNRVFYGNYVEGFDNVPTEATVTPISKVRPQDFISYDVKLKPATCHSESVFSQYYEDFFVLGSEVNQVKNKNSAFVIDTSELPDNTAIEENDQFTLTFSILPDNNWHIYDAKDAYHQHNQLGDFWENDPNFGVEGSPEFLQNYYWQNSVDSGQNNVANGPDPLDGGGGNFIPAQVESGVVNSSTNNTQSGTTENNFTWNYIFPDGQSSAPTPTRFGTSAANPLIVQAKPVSISLTLRADQPNITREDVSTAIAEALSEESQSGDYVHNAKFQVVSANFGTTYSYSLGLNNGSSFSMTDSFAKLIVMTGDNEFESGTLHGNFILNKATVELGFFEDKAYTYDTGNDQTTDNYYFGEGIYEDPDTGETNTDNRRVGIYIKQIYNVEVLTCLRKGKPNSPWHVYDSNHIYGVTPSEDLSEGPFAEDFWPSLTDPFGSGGEFETHVGKLNFTDNLTENKPFFKGTIAEAATSLSCFTVLDGKGGIAGGPASLSGDLPYDSENVLVAPPLEHIFGISNLGSAPMQVSGSSQASLLSGPIIDNNARGFMPLHNSNGIATPLIDTDGNPITVDISLQHSAALILGDSFFITSSQGDGERSFKSGANHAFGVVYYDYRGRASSVYPIGTAYAPAYYNRPDNNYGRIEMQIALLHGAPPWAKDFQIVYSGNTSVSDFTQYTTGGAFYVEGEDEAEDGNIYVSLNYLQENNDVSYTEAFGARSPEGAADMYTFKEGDLLRVISYYTSDDNRVFVDNRFLFEVAGQRTLSSGEDNPLFNEAEDADIVHPSKQGNFIILKNKPDADGFAYYDVQQGGNDPDSPAHNWNKRCVVEIISPSDSQAEDNIVFYETSKVFQIGQHNSTITMANGDVWWRRVPVNMPEFDGTFKNLILEEGSQPRFAPYYLETKAFNDTVRNADVTGEGKLKIVLPDAQESRRSTSITYSEKNNPASSVFQLTSFNPAKLQFKDLPIEHGNINYLLAQQDSLFVIQANRCASVPVDRNIITTASNDQSLVAASNVLGTQRYYAGKYGCDNNPESVCAVGNNVYFASKSNSQVYRFNSSNGIEVISDKGMKSFFRRTFRDVIFNQAELGVAKIVGGYDPAKDEYIISIFNQNLASFETSGEGVNTGTPLSNALEAQLWEFIDATINVNQSDPSGVGSQVTLFNIENYPQNIQNFYNNYSGNLNLDDSYLLDVTGDGAFSIGDIQSSNVIRAGLQVAATNAMQSIQQNTLVPIIAAMANDPDVDTSDLDTPTEIASYINGRHQTIADQKVKISDLQAEIYAGPDGTGTRNEPAGGTLLQQISSLQADFETAVQDLQTEEGVSGGLAAELAPWLTLSANNNNLGPEQIQARLNKLQAFENAINGAGLDAGLSNLNSIISGYEQFEALGGNSQALQNGLNTMQALINVGIGDNAIGDFNNLLYGVQLLDTATIEGYITDGVLYSQLPTAQSNQVLNILGSAGYSQNASGLGDMLSDLQGWISLGGQSIGANTADNNQTAFDYVTEQLAELDSFQSIVDDNFNPLTADDIKQILSHYYQYKNLGSVETFESYLNIQVPELFNSTLTTLEEGYGVGSALTPETISEIIDIFTAYDVIGSVDQFESFSQLGDFSDVQESLSNLQSLIDVGGWNSFTQAQEAIQNAYNFNETYASAVGGYSSADLSAILADYGLFESLGFSVSNGMFAGSLGNPSSAYSNALSTTGNQDEIDALTSLAAQNLAALNSWAQNLGIASAEYQSIAQGLEDLEAVTMGFEFIESNGPVATFDFDGDGVITTADLLGFLGQFGSEVGTSSGGVLIDPEAAIAAEMLELRSHLVSVGLSLGAHGWSPIDNLYDLDPEGATFGEAEITVNQAASLAPAVNAALTELKSWTSAFRGVFDEEGGGENYYVYNTSTEGGTQVGTSTNFITAGTPVSWGDIISGSAEGNFSLSSALSTIYEANNNWNPYIPSNLLEAINSSSSAGGSYDDGYTDGYNDGTASGGNGGNTHTSLKSYIQSNGITRDEYQSLMVSMQNLSEDGIAFAQLGMNAVADEAIGSADLLQFLVAYGSTLDELGGGSLTWLDPEHIYTPLMEN